MKIKDSKKQLKTTLHCLTDSMFVPFVVELKLFFCFFQFLGQILLFLRDRKKYFRQKKMQLFQTTFMFVAKLTTTKTK